MIRVLKQSEKEEIPRSPQKGTFELTIRCNLHCKMCLFRHADCENQQIRQRERSATEWIDMARQVAEAGTLQLLLSGGEPMLRSDFCELYEGIYKQGFLLELYTNATLVTPKIMDTLRKYPPHSIGVTLYGASAETYEKVCGNGQAFAAAIEGIRQLATLPSELKFRTTLIQDNLEDLEAMERWVKDEFGEDKILVHSQNVYCGVRGAESCAQQVRLTPTQNVELFIRRELDRIQEEIGETPLDKNKVFYISPQQMVEELDSKEVADSFFGCDAGVLSYTISWDGRLLGCQLIDRYATNPFEEGFLPAWERYEEIVEPVEEPENCSSCEYKQYCSSCAAVRYAETGSLSGIPSYICEEAQQLKEAMNKMREERI